MASWVSTQIQKQHQEKHESSDTLILVALLYDERFLDTKHTATKMSHVRVVCTEKSVVCMSTKEPTGHINQISIDEPKAKQSVYVRVLLFYLMTGNHTKKHQDIGPSSGSHLGKSPSFQI